MSVVLHADKVTWVELVETPSPSVKLVTFSDFSLGPIFVFSFEISTNALPREDARALKMRIRPPYPQRILKGD